MPLTGSDGVAVDGAGGVVAAVVAAAVAAPLGGVGTEEGVGGAEGLGLGLDVAMPGVWGPWEAAIPTMHRNRARTISRPAGEILWKMPIPASWFAR